MGIGGSLFLGLLATGCGAGIVAVAQTVLPEVVVRASKKAPKRVPHTAHMPARETPATAAAREFAAKTEAFNRARDRTILPKIGTSTYELSHDAIEALPQGDNQSIGKVLLQAPGVHQESAGSLEGPFHVRNEHDFVQYRMNGIPLPDGIYGFAPLLETSFIGNVSLVTGALPAQYGFRTSALIDITTRNGLAPGGSVSVYGGSRQTFTPSFEYGGTVGKTEYFVTGRFFESNEGIENPTSSLNPIHDYTTQAKFFGYMSTFLDDTTRLSIISGSSVGQFQIPNNPGQTPAFSEFVGETPNSLNSSLLNERQFETNLYNVAALQKSVNGFDLLLAAYSRYTSIHFVPDPIGDIVFNGVASDVLRTSFLNGIQGDGAYRLNAAHTLRAGFLISEEQTQQNNSSLLLPLGAGPPCNAAAPFNVPCDVVDNVSKVGWLLGSYVQDEWKVTDKVTINAGMRFDQMYQFVDANQLSPRLSVEYKPFDTTTVHAGYARYFTTPVQASAAPVNLALFQNTTAAPAVNQESPVLPERSHYFDAGVDQKVLPGLTVGVDGYYKIARDVLDDGQFGQALVLTEFNFEKGINEGVELKAKYQNGNFKAYGNLALSREIATNIVSNQFLFDPDELAYIATHYIYADHSQTWTGSAGASYLWQGTRFSTDMIYGSGMRSGFANTDHVPGYTQFNVGLTHEFASLAPDAKPFTLRFDVVNVFDTVYQIRNGTGIGVFAPAFGPRRGFFAGLSQKL
jgi:TonB-dependent receptor-like protein